MLELELELEIELALELELELKLEIELEKGGGIWGEWGVGREAPVLLSRFSRLQSAAHALSCITATAATIRGHSRGHVL